MLLSSFHSRVINSCSDALPTKPPGALAPKVSTQCFVLAPGPRAAEAPRIEATAWTILGLFFSIHIRPRAPAAVNLLGLLVDTFDLDSVAKRNGFRETRNPSQTSFSKGSTATAPQTGSVKNVSNSN